MKEQLLRLKNWLTPALAFAFGGLMLSGLAARAQPLPTCVYGTGNQAPCTVGNSIVLVSDPSGVFAGSIAATTGEGGITNDPLNPGFFTGNIVESGSAGQVSRSGSMTLATLSGLPTIVGVSVSMSCGVTGAATASLSLSTGPGSSTVLTCPKFQIRSGTALVTGSITFAPVSSVTTNITLSGAAPSSSDTVTWTNISAQLSLTPTYFFSHLAFGGGYQTTLTYLNYSPQSVNCKTTFLSDSGAALTVPFADVTASSRTDNLGPGASIHVQTQAAVGAPVSGGWAQAQCTGPIKASLLYRLYNSSGVPQGEAGVNAMAAPAREFVTFAESHTENSTEISTGVAWANPTTQPAEVTITALDAKTGASQGSTTFNLPSMAHGAANVSCSTGCLFKLASTFTGSIQITSTVPIVSLSLNAEAFPVFSSLPPGDLPDGTSMSTAP
jgi:hypothetical protein